MFSNDKARAAGSSAGRRLMATCVTWLLAVSGGSARGQLITEDAGFKSAPETPILQEWFTAFESEQVLDFRLEHRLYLRFDEHSEFKLTVPTILSRQVSFQGLGGENIRESSGGLGDVTLHYKLSLWQTDDVMVSNRWALLAEVTAPTGDHDKRDGGVEIPRHLQLGTGSWGFGAGTAVTWIRDRHRFSTEFMFRHRLRHDGFQPAQTWHANLAYWYRLTPVEFDEDGGEQELRAVIELLNTYHMESEFGDRDNGDDGLETWIAPGLQWFVRPDILFDFGVQLPLVQNVDDESGDGRWRATAAIRILF